VLPGSRRPLVPVATLLVEPVSLGITIKEGQDSLLDCRSCAGLNVLELLVRVVVSDAVTLAKCAAGKAAEQ